MIRVIFAKDLFRTVSRFISEQSDSAKTLEMRCI